MLSWDDEVTSTPAPRAAQPQFQPQAPAQAAATSALPPDGAPNAAAMNFGDSLSQFLAQIGRFGSFHSDHKPWPFADWPTPRTPEGEAPHVVPSAPHPARDEEPKL